jgi:hypothetical protein
MQHEELSVDTCKTRIISRKACPERSRRDAKHVLRRRRGRKEKQYKISNLAFLAPWREEYPSAIKNSRLSRKFESRWQCQVTHNKPEDPFSLSNLLKSGHAVDNRESRTRLEVTRGRPSIFPFCFSSAFFRCWLIHFRYNMNLPTS